MARTILGKHAHLLAQETGVPLRAIQGFFNIYIALVSDLDIDPDKLKEKYLEMKRIWRRTIKFWPFPPSIHRIYHISLVIRCLRKIAPTLRIGLMGEEAGEAANKILKAYQLGTIHILHKHFIGNGLLG